MKIDLKTLVYVSMLVAIEIVLSRFMSIATPIVKIGFGFVPIAVCAMLYGPIWAGIAGGMADMIGAILFPIGDYFPGFTLSAALTGVVFGLFMYKKENHWDRRRAMLDIGFAVSINCLGISLCISTLWLSILYGTPYFVLLPTRILQCAIMIPLQYVMIFAIHKVVLNVKKQYA